MSEQAPSIVNGNVPPRRLPNAARRPREYLTADEVERLMRRPCHGPAATAIATPP